MHLVEQVHPGLDPAIERGLAVDQLLVVQQVVLARVAGLFRRLGEGDGVAPAVVRPGDDDQAVVVVLEIDSRRLQVGEPAHRSGGQVEGSREPAVELGLAAAGGGSARATARSIARA